jgi:menaquinol-cytochrome c reductase iron-sulfur subunit
MEGDHSTLGAGPEATRRGFMKGATTILLSLCALLLGVPFVGSLIGPMYRRHKPDWIHMGPIGDLPVGQPVSLDTTDISHDAYLEQSTVRHVWVIKHSPDSVTVFSPVCPHLGCHYNWDPNDHRFECPCHGSVFTINGRVGGGPAPRPLDTLQHRIEDGRLIVRWQVFESGIPQKVPV